MKSGHTFLKHTAVALLLLVSASAPVQAYSVTLPTPNRLTHFYQCGWGKSAWDGIRHVGELIGEHIAIAELLEYLKSLLHGANDDSSLPPEVRVCNALRKLVVKAREIEHLTAKEKAAIVSRLEELIAFKCEADEKATVLPKADKQK